MRALKTTVFYRALTQIFRLSASTGGSKLSKKDDHLVQPQQPLWDSIWGRPPMSPPEHIKAGKSRNGILLPKLFWPTVRKIVLVIETCSWRFLITSKLEQFKFKLEKIIGI